MMVMTISTTQIQSTGILHDVRSTYKHTLLTLLLFVCFFSFFLFLGHFHCVFCCILLLLFVVNKAYQYSTYLKVVHAVMISLDFQRQQKLKQYDALADLQETYGFKSTNDKSKPTSQHGTFFTILGIPFNIFAMAEVAMDVTNKRYYIEKLQKLM